jgi:hypothetical protein
MTRGDRVVWRARTPATVVATGTDRDGLVMIKIDADGRLWRVPSAELSPPPSPSPKHVPLFGVLVLSGDK